MDGAGPQQQGDRGAAIGRTEETAKIHLKSIFAKLKVATRTEAVRVAVSRGLVHLD